MKTVFYMKNNKIQSGEVIGHLQLTGKMNLIFHDFEQTSEKPLLLYCLSNYEIQRAADCFDTKDELLKKL